MNENKFEEVKNESVDGKKKANKRKIIIIAIILVLVLVIGLFFIFYNKKRETGKIDTGRKEVYSEYRLSGNKLEDFDLRFLQLETDNKNIVYSPLSIKYALQMLAEGTNGTSKAQLDAIIGDYQARKYINSSNMSFGNAMFIHNTLNGKVKEDYIKRLKNKYNAEVIYDTFENPDNVNSWVSDKTFGLIDKLFDNVNDTKFILINALAIDMDWNKVIQASSIMDDNYLVDYKHENYDAHISPLSDGGYGAVKFNDDSMKVKASEIGASINNYDIVKTLGEDNIRKTITRKYQEWLTSDESKYCSEIIDIEQDVNKYVNQYIEEIDKNYKQIKASTDFRFHVDDDVKVFAKELKEYDGITLEYVGIMPKNKKLSEFIKNTNAANLNQIMDKLKTIELKNFEEGKVTKIIGGIPLFNYEYELKLEEDLKKIGVTDIFDPERIDLSGIAAFEDIVIKAKHKANIEFSNEGIKASAATSVEGLGGASCGFEYLYDVPVEEIDLTFDNPYMYIIRDKNSGEVWFMGTVDRPIENSNPNARIINEKK